MELLCGLDEAGRGPLAGPVTAGAVILPKDFPFEILNDSKKLSEKKRNVAELVIKEKACWGLGIVSHTLIDEMNILKASMYAMELAFDELLKKLPEWLKVQGIDEYSITCLADGITTPNINGVLVKCEPKADAKYHEVMAASIIAKVERDRIMCDMDKLYPEYGYAKHKGYPTKAHRAICHEKGPSPIQRLTFKY